ncbi:ead/Ea22-like family protein [Salmonella enterica]|nr:ead/Ea22-like family protein [Salmonella enterica]EKM4763379.1 ead/Ea22-like family protein [Salmonella enterica]
MSNIDKQALRSREEFEEYYNETHAVKVTSQFKRFGYYVSPTMQKAWELWQKAQSSMLDELKTKEEQRANWFQMAQKLGEDLDAAEKRNAEQREYYEGVIADGSNRIAELEAREVNLSKLSVGEVMHMSGFSRDYAEGWCAGNDNAIHEIRTAGIKVKGE